MLNKKELVMSAVYLVLRKWHEDENSILGAFTTKALAEEYNDAITRSEGEENCYVYAIPLDERPNFD